MISRLWSTYKGEQPFEQEIDPRHPWCQGLVMFWDFAAGAGLPREIISGTAPSASTAFGWSIDGNGSTGSFNGTTTNLTYTQLRSVGPAVSWAGRCVMVDATSNSMLIERSTVNATWAILTQGSTLRARGGYELDRSSFYIGSLSNTWFSWCFRDNGSATSNTANCVGYLNGIPQINPDNDNTAPIANTNDIHLGNYDNSNYFLNGRQDWHAVWNYQIPHAMAVEIGSSSNAIRQIYRRRQMAFASAAFHPYLILHQPTIGSGIF